MTESSQTENTGESPEPSPPQPRPPEEKPPQPPVTQEPLGLAMKICPKCRTPNLPNSQFCYRCGAPLPEKPDVPGEVPGTRPGGFWARFLAYLIDTVIVSIMGGIVLSVILVVFPNALPGLQRNASFQEVMQSALSPQTSADWSLFYISIIFFMLYWTIATGWAGRTLGKAVFRLKVVRTDGSSLGYGRALIRWLVFFLVLWPTAGIGHIIIVFNPDRRGLHDIVCDTRVIKT